MSSSSSPADSQAELVADASVVINLNATGRAAAIIRSLPNPVVVTENAVAELRRGVASGHKDSEMLQELVENGIVQIVQLNEAANNVFASLIEGSAQTTLHDGEAATIAYASVAGSIPILDERKARIVCGTSFSALVLSSTSDLLLCEPVRCALGDEGQVQAILGALRGARMRVRPENLQQVLDVIGEETASSCPSLPRAKRGKTGGSS